MLIGLFSVNKAIDMLEVVSSLEMKLVLNMSFNRSKVSPLYEFNRLFLTCLRHTSCMASPSS